MSDLKTIRTDVVGSLLRPAAVIEARKKFDEGELDAAGLRAIEDEAVRAAVKLQESIGLDVISDGEVRRLNFQDSFGAAVEGFDAAASTVHAYSKRVEGGTALRRWEVPVQEKGTAISHRRPVTSRLKLKRNVPLEEYKFVAGVAKTPAKVSLIGPDRISQRFDHQNSKAVYADMDAFVADVVAIEREIIKSVVDAGCRYIHIDAPGYTAYVDEPSKQQMRDRGEDPDAEFFALAEGRHGGDRGFSRRRRSASIFAAATSAACGIARAAMTPSRSSCSPSCRTTASCSNTTARAPAASRRCDSCRKARSRCSGWSAPKSRRWKASTRSSAASTRRPRSFRSTNSPSARNAASRRTLLEI